MFSSPGYMSSTSLNPYHHILNQNTYTSGQNLMSQAINNGVHLYLFRPRNYTPQVHRSYIYNFGEGAIKDTLVELAVNHIHNTNTPNNKAILSDPTFNTAILPNAEGIQYNVSLLNDLWSFLLIIDVTRNSIIPNQVMTELISSIDCRYIYVGFFDSEPINPINHGNGVTINPMATMVITHYTHINNGRAFHAHGTQQNISVLSDIDVVPPQLPVNLSIASTPENKVSVINTPDKVVETSHNSIDGRYSTNITMAVTPSAQLTNKHQSVFIPTHLNSPKHQLMDIKNTLADAMETVIADEGVHISNPSVFSHADDYKQVVQEQMYVNMSTMYNQSTIGLAPIDPLRPLTMSQLSSMFPNMQITDCIVPKDTTWDVKDPVAPNLENVYSTLVSVSLPAMLQNYGIAQIAFRYTSYIPGSTVFDGSRDKIELIDIAMVVPCPEDMVRHRFNSLYQQLKTSIFPMIRQAGGEFDLIVISSIGGTNVVSLNFLDAGIYTNPGFYTTYNNLGGIASPLVGTTPEHYHNAANIYNLVNYIAPDM